MLKIFKFSIIFIFVISCGYTPIYSNLKNKDINIQIKNINGDKNINNLIVQKLERYQNEKTNNIFNLDVKSEFQKLTLTKDAAGNATNFRLKLDIVFTATKDGNSEKYIFFEKFDMKKGDTIFEEQKYENFIKNDMTNIIIQKFISQLLIKS